MSEQGEGAGAGVDESEVDTRTHEVEGSMVQGWPAILITIGIIAAALYSFSPRPDPSFPETRVRAGDVIVNDLAHQGQRYIAAGEQGVILIADAPDGPWSRAQVSPDRGSTFTRVRFVAQGTAVAVGHDSWIVRSTDGGGSWQEIEFSPQRSEPIINLGGPFDGRLFALGAFGKFLESTDLGQSWTAREIVAAEEEAEEAAYDPTTDPESPEYDPFAAFSSGAIAEDFSTFHLNAMDRLDDGRYLLVGERGLIARSDDDTRTWKRLQDIYSGSFYGVLRLDGGRVLIHGMRGHAFYSDDGGDSWTPSRIPSDESLFGGMVTGDGRLVLVGANNTIVVSTDRGATFSKVSGKGAAALAAVLPAPGGWLTAGEAGVAVQKPATDVAQAEGGAS